MIKAKELKNKPTEELKRLYVDLCQKRQELNFKVANRQLKTVREVRAIKKNIARILTYFKEREAANQVAATLEAKAKNKE